MPDASDNGACRPFEVHDFVPLLARMIKIVNQSRKTPLFTENHSSRCMILFRFGMFLFCSGRWLELPNIETWRCIVLFRFEGETVTKRELARFCSALLHSIVYFTSKQRSLSGWASQNVPILFRACARSGIYRGIRPHRGA